MSEPRRPRSPPWLPRLRADAESGDGEAARRVRSLDRALAQRARLQDVARRLGGRSAGDEDELLEVEATCGLGRFARAVLASLRDGPAPIAEAWCVGADAAELAPDPSKRRQLRAWSTLLRRGLVTAPPWEIGPDGWPVGDAALTEEGERIASRLRVPRALRRDHRATATAGGLAVEPDAPRALPVDWSADPLRLAERLADCGAVWGVSMVRAGGPGEREEGEGDRPVAVSIPCRCQQCPVCASYAAARRARELGPLIEALAAAGYPVCHLTLTRRIPRTGGAPVVLTPGDLADFEGMLTWARKKHPGRSVRLEVVGPDGAPVVAPVPSPVGPGGLDELAIGRAVPGESVTDALGALYSGWRRLVDARASRAGWREAVAGYVRGVELTSRRIEIRDDEDGGATLRVVLRWHAHLHVLVVLHPGVDVGRVELDGRGEHVGDGGWWQAVRDRWIASLPAGDESSGSGGLPVAQRCVLLPTGRSEDVRATIRECLKYPFKVGSMTAAQVFEVLTSTKGLRWHLLGGGLHGGSSVAGLVRGLDAGAEGSAAELEAAERALEAHRCEAVRALARRDGLEPADLPETLGCRRERQLARDLWRIRAEIRAAEVLAPIETAYRDPDPAIDDPEAVAGGQRRRVYVHEIEALHRENPAGEIQLFRRDGPRSVPMGRPWKVAELLEALRTAPPESAGLVPAD